VEIVSQETVKNDGVNLFGLLTSLKIRNTELIFYGGMDDGAGRILQQMKQLGMNTIFMGGDGICTHDFFEISGRSFNDGQVICAEAGGIEHSRKDGMEKFRSDFKAIFGNEVQVYAPYTFDAVHVMAKAMINANSTSPQKYLSALKGIKHNGVTGQISFDSKGDIVSGAITLMTYRDGHRMTFDVIR
jgi:branched-chain amino acid transport system substrate-binding protein